MTPSVTQAQLPHRVGGVGASETAREQEHRGQGQALPAGGWVNCEEEWCQAPLRPRASHPVVRSRQKGRLQAEGRAVGSRVRQAQVLASRNTARAAMPGRSSHPALTAHHPGCRNRPFHPLQCCSREQQSKTNMQTRQTYFFDSLN